MYKTITAYNNDQTSANRKICKALQKEIDSTLKTAESKIWHGHPVWFINENPITGYSKVKDGVQLLFWSGQSFDEAGLKKEGSFKAAEIRYAKDDEINLKDLRRWLKKAKLIQWDYKNIVKRKGRLVKLAV
mgnify:FL=1